jgi:hypothetical protein
LPAGCSRIDWTVAPTRIPDGFADVSRQQTFSIENKQWILIAEPTAFLRISGDAQPYLLQQGNGSSELIGAKRSPDGAWDVPAADDAPEYFVAGRAAVIRTRVGPLRVQYVCDDEDRVTSLRLLDIHRRALDYLSRVISLPAREESLMVVWVGIDRRNGRAGGSAGRRSFVANYVFGENPEARDAARTMLVLTHEQFHQLVGLVRTGLPSLPVWIGESLAQYYALEALQASGLGRGAEDIRREFVDPARPVDHGLLELNRRNASVQPESYALFYTQGATLWAEIDKALKASSHGSRSLADFMPGLLRSRFDSGARLPDEFVAGVTAAGGARVTEAIDRYVGS